MDYESLSRIFQDAGQAIRAGDSRLVRIDVSNPGFLAQRDLPPIVRTSQLVPQPVATPREESASSWHSLNIEINQFHFEEEEKAPEGLVELSDFEAESNRFSVVHHPRLIVARPDTSSEEGEGMDLRQRPGLKGLIANRSKGSTLKDVPKTQVPTNLPPSPPPPVTMVGLLPNPDLKKKRKVPEAEEGEMVPPKGTKQERQG